MINFDNSKFFYDPFPHCILDEFLENKIYDEICNEYPDQSYFEEVKSKEGDDKFKKYRFANSQKNAKIFDKFISSTKSTKKLYNYLSSEKFIKSLDKFFLNNQIELRFNNQENSNIKKIIKNLFFKKSKIDFEFSSIPMQGGYILPHTDGGNKLVGFVIPIIDNNNVYNAENIGTKIFRAKTNEYKFNFYNKTVPFEHAELIRELPFKRNQISLHIKTFNSLHGVGPIINKSNDQTLFRKSISIFLLK